MAAMPTYASAAQIEALLPGVDVTDAAAFDRLIERAERDVDDLLGPWPRSVQLGGLKWDLSRLDAWQADAVRRAVAAQVEYLLAVGEHTFVTPTPTRTKGPDFEVEYGDGGQRPRHGPRVAVELAPVRDLVTVNGARARA